MGNTKKAEQDLKWWTPKPHKPHYMGGKLLKISLESGAELQPHPRKGCNKKFTKKNLQHS